MAQNTDDGVRRRRVLAAAGTGVAAALAGCGGETGDGSTSESTEGTTDEATATSEPTTESGASGRVTLLHDTHVHGRYGGADDAANVEHYFGLMTDLAAEADGEPLLLGSGDDLASSVLSAAFDGSHVVDAFDAGGLGYDTFGNHDFDMGPGTARERVADSDFTWLSANVVEAGTEAVFAGEQGAKRHALVDAGGVTVGLTGVIHADAPDVTSMGEAAEVQDPTESVRTAVGELRDGGAEAVVVLSHLAGADAVALAESVDGIDAVVGDHAANLLDEPRVVNGTVCSFVGDGYDYVGEVDLVVEDGAVADHAFRRHDTAAAVEDGLEPHPDVAEVATSYRSELDAELGATIGETTEPLDVRQSVVRKRESNFGNYIADTIRAAADADIALTNGGGIRTDRVYEAGEITKRTVVDVLPFPNNVVKLEVSGETLRAALEHGVGAVEESSGRFPQVSGIAYTYDPDAEPGSRIVEATVGGEPIDDGATYELGTNDFVAGGGDGYGGLAAAETLVGANDGALLSTAVIDAIEADGTISPTVEGRITVE
ncbi:2',3'-cyclic-nucleotide 2'-phosphodiesterase [Halobacteriales archaeon QS_6_71_20]|nr:MAG: 2',3'-cyclic-nucleotide 2'-phosphodiesterase [Halobacteriales archaeon QS_6_71_20]